MAKNCSTLLASEKKANMDGDEETHNIKERNCKHEAGQGSPQARKASINDT